MRKTFEKQNISGSSNKSSIGKRNRRRGNDYERKIVNELIKLTHDSSLSTSRRESKSLDDSKIDVADPNNTLPFYIQIKCTQAVPQIKKLNNEVGKKDKPLVIIWNSQERREKKQISAGEYVILPKSLFYYILEQFF